MEASNQQSCENCTHFLFTDLDEKKGLCRRYPPQIIIPGGSIEEPKSDIPTMDFHFEYDYPTTYFIQKCGEFKPRKADVGFNQIAELIGKLTTSCIFHNNESAVLNELGDTLAALKVPGLFVAVFKSLAETAQQAEEYRALKSPEGQS